LNLKAASWPRSSFLEAKKNSWQLKKTAGSQKRNFQEAASSLKKLLLGTEAKKNSFWED